MLMPMLKLILSWLNITIMIIPIHLPSILGLNQIITKAAVNLIILPQIPHPFYFEFSFTLYFHNIPTYDGWVLKMLSEGRIEE